MIKMLLFEIKKIYSRHINKIALLILVVLLFVVSTLAIKSVSYVDADGNTLTGIKAVQSLKAEKNKWSGYVDEDMLLKVLEANSTVNASDEYLSTNIQENDKAYSKKQGFSDIRELINCGFCFFQQYDYYRADSVRADEVGNLYENRISNLDEWLKSDDIKYNYSDAQKEFLREQYENLKIPFYYEYADGWKALLEYMSSLIMLLVLILGFLVSGIFSNEFQLNADSIFFSTKLGRNKAIISKIGAGFTIVTALYFGVMLLYSMIVLGVLGADGAGCAIQTSLGGWKSFYNITYLQEYLLALLGGYLGCLFISSLCMLISAKTRSTVIAVIIPFILIFIPSFLSDISILSNILGLLPDRLLQINQAIRLFNIYEIGGKVVGAVPIIMILYSILSCILLPILYNTYRKVEIR